MYNTNDENVYFSSKKMFFFSIQNLFNIKMMKIKSLHLLILFISIKFHSQVGINTLPPHQSSTFDMSDSKRGFLAPRVALSGNTDVSTIPSPKEGTMIFNTSQNTTVGPGYYYRNSSTSKWEPFHETTDEEVSDTSILMYASTLGYAPSGKSSESPATFSLGGVTATKQTCSQFTDTFSGATTHYYCSYNLSNSVTWEQAFNMAKFLKGYLLVATTANEWNFVKNNLLGIGGNSGNNSWIGYNTIQYPGNARQFTWITGEKSTIIWSNDSSLEANYATNQPSGTTGCVRISPSSNVDRKWYNNNCTSTNLDSAPINYLIIEFNNN